MQAGTGLTERIKIHLQEPTGHHVVSMWYWSCKCGDGGGPFGQYDEAHGAARVHDKDCLWEDPADMIQDDGA